MTAILLYAEDRLLEALGHAIVAHAGLSVRISKITGGRGDLENALPRLNAAAAHVPVLALLDRDRRGPCPGAEVTRLVPRRHPSMLLRFAVEEADAWLLADNEALSRFLGISAGKIPNAPEAEPDPKQTLMQLARGARAKDRRRIAPSQGMHASVGPAYNGLLCAFVARDWSVDRARVRAPSLARCVAAVHALRG